VSATAPASVPRFAGRGWTGSRLPWVVLALVVGVSLWAGAAPRHTPSLDQRVRQVAADVRCPSCTDLTAADSNAPTAVAVRQTIRQGLQQGQSPAQIESWLAGRYGRDILLRPPTRGVAGLVWELPVAGAVIALGALAFAFARWRRAVSGGDPAEADRRLVEEALARSGGPPGDEP